MCSAKSGRILPALTQNGQENDKLEKKSIVLERQNSMSIYQIWFLLS